MGMARQSVQVANTRSLALFAFLTFSGCAWPSKSCSLFRDYPCQSTGLRPLYKRFHSGRSVGVASTTRSTLYHVVYTVCPHPHKAPVLSLTSAW